MDTGKKRRNRQGCQCDNRPRSAPRILPHPPPQPLACGYGQNLLRTKSGKLHSTPWHRVVGAVQTEKRVWSDRIKKVDNVIIPSMCFFHLVCNTKKEVSRKLLSVLKEPYILKILTMPGSSAPAVIPDNQIQQLKYMLNYADSPVLFSEGRHFKKGDRVRVCRGKLKDFEGYVTRATDAYPPAYS